MFICIDGMGLNDNTAGSQLRLCLGLEILCNFKGKKQKYFYMFNFMDLTPFPSLNTKMPGGWWLAYVGGGGVGEEGGIDKRFGLNLLIL